MRIYLVIFLLCCEVIISTQDARPKKAGGRIVYGEVVTGSINNTHPYETYIFEGLRCDFLSIRLTTTFGDLDPILTIMDHDGDPVFIRDDSSGILDVIYDPVAIPKNGEYTVVVGRFGYDLGTTAGRYELLIEQIGNGSAYGCAMRYGDTVVNNVTNMQPQLIYSFRSKQGDIVNVRMERRSGDLDPYLLIADYNSFIHAENDDILGGGTDAEIQSLLIPEDGTYYIIATRYGLETGRSEGNFILTLSEAVNSGLGNSVFAAIPIRIGTRGEGELTEDIYENYYRFEAKQNDIITVLMDRLSGNIDAYLVITDANLRELVFNDDSREGQNATIEEYLIPEDGTYYIIATRFERKEGNTTGEYRLETSNLGNAFDDVPTDIRRMTYGSSTTGTIDDINPDVYIAFWGLEEDTITISLNNGGGDLDPFVSLLADDQTRVLSRDDDSGGGQNARIESYTLPYTGVYYIRASRYEGQDNPGTEGSYTLILTRRIDDND